MDDRGGAQVGEVPGVPVGSTFQSRAEVLEAGLHRYGVNGIDYDRVSGLSVAIVLNGGYKDDQDLGSHVIYTGEGGQDESRRYQVRDQEWVKGNAGLRKASTAGTPVRIIRGPKPKNDHSPKSGYRYDGLYSVTKASLVPSKDGPLVCQFELEAIPGASAFDQPAAAGDLGTDQPDRVPTLAMRTVRDTLVALEVKRLHDYRCQACGTRLETPSGPYAEGAHIRPLGRPHLGPDRMENVLCLCPNHHLLFDKGAWTVDDAGAIDGGLDHSLLDRLRQVEGHRVDSTALEYHRQRIARGATRP